MNHSLPRAPRARCPLSPRPPPRHECITAFPVVPRPGKMGTEELKTKRVSPLGESRYWGVEAGAGTSSPASPVCSRQLSPPSAQTHLSTKVSPLALRPIGTEPARAHWPCLSLVVTAIAPHWAGVFLNACPGLYPPRPPKQPLAGGPAQPRARCTALGHVQEGRPPPASRPVASRTDPPRAPTPSWARMWSG